MITGIHALIYSQKAGRVKDFLRQLGWHYVDAGNDRLIFAAPPTEIAVHETESESGHELWFVCDDVHATITELASKGVSATPVVDRGWGLVTELTLPSGDKIGLYQQQHDSPIHR